MLVSDTTRAVMFTTGSGGAICVACDVREEINCDRARSQRLYKKQKLQRLSRYGDQALFKIQPT